MARLERERKETVNKAALLRQLWRDRLHTEPSALDGSGRQWASIWEPGERLLAALACLPGGLLSFWLRTGRGHVVIGAAPSGYASGWQEWREQRYEGLCRLHSADIAADNAALWSALLACCDHLLGSRGQDGGARFSDGQGATPRLQAAAARLQRSCGVGLCERVAGLVTAGRGRLSGRRLATVFARADATQCGRSAILSRVGR